MNFRDECGVGFRGFKGRLLDVDERECPNVYKTSRVSLQLSHVFIVVTAVPDSIVMNM